MDINRYYVPVKPRKEAPEEREKKHKAATSRFQATGTTRLPTPQAFFERQQKFKQDDKKAMLRFAQKRVVKHNLKLRRNELKVKQQKQIEELAEKIYGRKTGASFSTVEGDVKEVPDVDVEPPVVEAKRPEKVENADGFEYKDLRASLDMGDNHEINRNVLIHFFELKDPSRVDEVDELLEIHQGHELELFDRIAKEYGVLKENPNAKPSMSDAVVRARIGSLQAMTDKPVRSTLVEHDPKEAPKFEEQAPPRQSQRKSSFIMRPMRKMSTRRTLLGASSVVSVDSILSVQSDVEGVKEFQEALDKEIKTKKHQGNYVTSIRQRGGKWWVNQNNGKKVHPSARRRNTLLDDLRSGNVPLSI